MAPSELYRTGTTRGGSVPLKKVLVPTVLPTKSLLDWILGASRAAVMVAAVTEVCRAGGARGAHAARAAGLNTNRTAVSVLLLKLQDDSRRGSPRP